MRERADETRIRAFLRELGRRSTVPARVYLTGGATAVLAGWLPELKERLDVNIELVAPGDFIPALPRWRDRSPFVCRAGLIDAHHLDPYSQALASADGGRPVRPRTASARLLKLGARRALRDGALVFESDSDAAKITLARRYGRGAQAVSVASRSRRPTVRRVAR